MLNFQAGAGQTLGSAANQVVLNTKPGTLETNAAKIGATVTDTTTNYGNSTVLNLATHAAGSVTTTSVAAMTLTTPVAYATLPTSGAVATTNYIVTSNTVIGTAESANALLIVGSAAGVTVSGANLTMGSNTPSEIVATGGAGTSATISTTNLVLGTGEGMVITGASSSLTISSIIAGSTAAANNALTIGGSGHADLQRRQYRDRHRGTGVGHTQSWHRDRSHRRRCEHVERPGGHDHRRRNEFDQ